MGFLDTAVVLVPAAALARLGHDEVGDRTQPGVKFRHAADGSARFSAEKSPAYQ
jgi:hypothetical protein